MEKSLYSKVRRIQIKTSKMVTEFFSGEYRSIFKGQGMEFEKVREYQIGDDVRNIDWNVTAKTDKPHVKIFSEERELTVIFLVDVSSSMLFGSKGRSKKELIAELCAVLSFTAVKNKDKVGVILFSDHIEKYIPPAKGKRHVLRVIRELLTIGQTKKKSNIKKQKTSLNAALKYLNKVIRKRAICFLVSDFFCDGFEHNLIISKKKHDLVAIKVEDQLENKFFKSSMVQMEDLESGENLLVDFSTLHNVELFQKNAMAEQKQMIDLFKKEGIDHFCIQTDQDYFLVLNKFFRMREKRIRR